MYRNRIAEHIVIDSSELRRNPLNHRRHPDSQRHALRSLLSTVGVVDELLAYRDPVHGLTLVDGEARWSEGGEWPVAVLDLTPDEALTVLAMLDKIGADAEIDPEALLALLDSLPVDARQTAGQAWSDDELAALLGEPEIVPGAGGDEFDPTPEDGPTRTALGELWIIGGVHRLLVGDCTDAANVARLMGDDKIELVWTDPPYGVAIGDKNKFLNSIAPSNRVEENLENDTLDEPALMEMLRGAFANAAAHCLAGGAWYVAAPPGPLHVLFGMALKELNIWLQTIQWVKNNATFAPLGVDYHWRAEPIFYGWLPGAAHRYHGGRQQDTVWEIDRPQASPEHPTMKPVELVQRAVENSSQVNDICYDGFAGSGTLLVAAHRTNRRAYLCEIAPRYADVILKRAEAEGLAVERAPA